MENTQVLRFFFSFDFVFLFWFYVRLRAILSKYMFNECFSHGNGTILRQVSSFHRALVRTHERFKFNAGFSRDGDRKFKFKFILSGVSETHEEFTSIF